MTRFKHALMFSMLATGAALATPAAAAIVVDTGTPTGGVQYTLATGYNLAGLFTLATATTITSVEGYMQGGLANGNIRIYTGGVDPQFSGLLHNASFAIAASPTGSWQGVFGQSWNLAAGQYWLTFSGDGSNSMQRGAPNPLSQHAFASNLAGPWSQQGSSIGLGVRITGDQTGGGPGAVPEPATWAMMLVGFGAIGGALRSRRRVSVSYG